MKPRYTVFLLALGSLIPATPTFALGVSNGAVSIQAAGTAGNWTGFDLWDRHTRIVRIRLSSSGLVAARRCTPSAHGLSFSGLQAKRGSGLELGVTDRVIVQLEPRSPYPTVLFRLTVRRFNAERWIATVGRQPFHFLCLYLPGAELWHQQGWLNATPVADPFPLLLDRHVGTPELSAYPYNRTWSYTPPLGANALPVIGLWNPSNRRYAGLEFQTTRMEDNSEREIASGYHWAGNGKNSFTALVFPYGGKGYQQLVFPTPGTVIASHGRLLWSDHLGPEQDPNELLWQFLWRRDSNSLPAVPAVDDLSWIPGGIRLKQFPEPAYPGMVSGPEGQFQTPGSLVPAGWDWYRESPVPVAVTTGNHRLLRVLEQQAQQLLPFAKRFTVQGDSCVFWEKPLKGEWTPQWGGKAVTTLHNANGFAIGRLFLDLVRYDGQKQYLPIVDGVFNWARHIGWTRAEFADVPSSPFAIGGTLPTAFLLDYHSTFQASPDPDHRRRAAEALDLARAFTYRTMVMWPSDNNRDDNLQSAFLWEPNSGRDWTGAACANEVFWNLDTLAQAAVETGDPVLIWALEGSLNRWHELYQDTTRSSLAQYGPADMAEGYGLYAGNIYGVGKHSSYGFASPLYLEDPVGDSRARVLAGERAAMVFDREGADTTIRDYRRSSDGSFAFTVRTTLPSLAISLTSPYQNLHGFSVALIRAGRRITLRPGADYQRPAQSLWSLYLNRVQNGDRVLVGGQEPFGPILPSTPPRTTGSTVQDPGATAWTPVPLPSHARAVRDWRQPTSWAGLPAGLLWACGIPVRIPQSESPALVTHAVRLPRPLPKGAVAAVFYRADRGAAPVVILSNGARMPVETRLAAVAWRAWPPLFTTRLLVAPVILHGATVVGVDPMGGEVLGLSVLPQSSGAGAIQGALRLLQEGATAREAEERAAAAESAIRQAVERIPQESFAVLPPSSSGSENVLVGAGLGSRGITLTPQQVADPTALTPARTPEAVYLDGEIYDTPENGSVVMQALQHYLAGGGVLALVGMGPYPMYYAHGPGGQTPDPVPPQLGLPLYNAVEESLPDKLMLRRASDRFPNLPATIPYPSGDPRLRSIDESKLPAGAVFTPIYRVVGESGKSYGAAAGLLKLPSGGQILYVWGGLLRDPVTDKDLAVDVASFLAARKK